ncbi:hypothetical protein PUN28_006741 [Cardiocondyla obscurior]|uniref:Uncharacterized protein n=1 Tax=Cardiocondyla obscurior TaxID=286306 RepID=A0AAW2FZQ2_9HYME
MKRSLIYFIATRLFISHIIAHKSIEESFRRPYVRAARKKFHIRSDLNVQFLYKIIQISIYLLKVITAYAIRTRSAENYNLVLVKSRYFKYIIVICNVGQKLWLQNDCAISRRVLHAFDCKPFPWEIASKLDTLCYPNLKGKFERFAYPNISSFIKKIKINKYVRELIIAIIHYSCSKKRCLRDRE